ncbi:MAG: indolepyruvate ferredoxin oxidoreductase family protein, partial [Alphaproteobacteria bacterium]|nr:indolepyruvate ferredoxin oxidoreductase family protein [Alphaproteobacteria bacterium]
RIVVVTDEPDKYPAGTNFPPGCTVRHRDELDAIQKELRQVEGLSVMIYDQTCAAEKRRRRKRGLYPDPPKRAFINDLVCEGCGDCSEKSNCVSVRPLETEFGRKRQIDQSNCNKDFSCVKGFCPSFVTVHGGSLRKSRARPRVSLAASGHKRVGEEAFADLPAPNPLPLTEPFSMIVTGIGGTGVLTVGALIGMAAHLEGRGCTVLDFTGLAQKNGAVMSHIRLAPQPEDIHAVRVAAGGARLVLGCDMVVAASPNGLSRVEAGVTRAVINSFVAPTAGFVLNGDLDFGAESMKKAIREAVGEGRAEFLDATQLATAILGDSIATNIFMLGYAVQKGLVPLSIEAIERAIELNGVAVETNKRTLNWGRLAAHDLDMVLAEAKPRLREDTPRELTLEELIDRRAGFLTEYQDAAYARTYRDFIAKVEAAEKAQARGRIGLAEAVAKNLFKLMAYKDEYEVARLYTDGSFLKKLGAEFEGDYKLEFHLAPPLLAPRDPMTGELQKRAYGPWMLTAFRMLAKFKGLRGTKWDIFGKTEERQMERRLIGEYRAAIEEGLATLTPETHATVLQLAGLPEQIRGFGHVKERSVKLAKTREANLIAVLRDPAKRAAAAE